MLYGSANPNPWSPLETGHTKVTKPDRNSEKNIFELNSWIVPNLQNRLRLVEVLCYLICLPEDEAVADLVATLDGEGVLPALAAPPDQEGSVHPKVLAAAALLCIAFGQLV